MHVESSFRVSSILLVAVAFLGLAAAARVPPILLLAGMASLALALAHAAGWKAGALAARLSQISTPVWNLLMVLAFVVCAVDLVWLSQDLLLVGTNFLIVLMINKVFNLHHRKDFLYLYAISFLMLLSTTSLTVEAWYALVFISYLLAAIWTLLLYHLKNEVEENRHTTQVATPVPITASFFWTTNGVACLALVLTLMIFFVTPRTGTGFFQKGHGQPIRMSGFSRQVDLGVMGSVKLDPTVVMRVDLPEREAPPEGPIYLQGALYDHYTGRSWINTLSRRHAVAELYRRSFLVSRTPQAWGARTTLQQNILIETLDAPVLFGVPEIQRVDGTFPLLQIDEIGGLHLPYPPSSRFQYTVFSAPTELTPKDKHATSFQYPHRITSRFLQLPPLSPRFTQLARAVTKNETTPYQKAIAVKWHLLGNYRYSLDVGNAVSASPVEDFLFDRKSGYCEHYATAMVLLLRSLDIPARLVTGFLAAEWNDFGHYYTVRQLDAHAWVEVYFPGSGWIIFDPTPSVTATPRNSPLEVVARLLDSFRVKWTRFVIQYSFRDQQAVLDRLREHSQPVRSRATEWVTTAMQWMKNWRAWALSRIRNWDWDWRLPVGGLGAVAVLWLIVRWRRKTTPLPPEFARCTPEQLVATRLYGRMLHLLRQHGFSKPPSLAPLEFARVVGFEREEAALFVKPLTDLYCRGRFGASPLTTDDVSRANGLLDELGTRLEQMRAAQDQPVGAVAR